MTVLYAAIDIGTTNIKTAVFNNGIEVILITDTPVAYNGSQVELIWSEFMGAMEAHLKYLSHYCSQQGIKDLRIGLCGQVSSLVHWDLKQKQAINKRVPIWLDKTCAPSIAAIKSLMDHGRDQEYLGSQLPVACNWLQVKLHHYVQSHSIQAEQSLVQIHDAIFHILTNALWTHPSSQISLAHQQQCCYHPALLSALGIKQQQLPTLRPWAMHDIDATRIQHYKLPHKSSIQVGMADMYAAFMGFYLEPSELLWQCNTSEIFAYCGDMDSKKALMQLPLLEQTIHYGSTNAGGRLIKWFQQRYAVKDSLDALTKAAARMEPGAEGLVFLPYLNGERAPLWNNNLKAAFYGLNDRHNIAHMFRAVLEGVAFGKRDMLAYFPDDCGLCKMAGGSTVNELWNQIRCDIIDKPITVLQQREIALGGALRSVMSAHKDAEHIEYLKSSYRFHHYVPHVQNRDHYEASFKLFKHAQRRLLATSSESSEELVCLKA